jgi:hypothetical protein
MFSSLIQTSVLFVSIYVDASVYETNKTVKRISWKENYAASASTSRIIRELLFFRFLLLKGR